MKEINSSGGIGFLGALGVLFIGLKLTGFITWSWWLVLFPIYAGWAIVPLILFLIGATVATFFFIGAGFAVVFSGAWDAWREHRKFSKIQKDIFKHNKERVKKILED